MNKTIVLGGLTKSLIHFLNKKRPTITKFALQLEDAPVYIIYEQLRANKVKLNIQDIGSKLQKTIIINMHDSMDNFLFVLSLIRDEYKAKVLFTDKSEFYD